MQLSGGRVTRWTISQSPRPLVGMHVMPMAVVKEQERARAAVAAGAPGPDNWCEHVYEVG